MTMKSYRNSRWHRFRNEVIELDGGVCRSCGRSEIDGVVLQVHHRAYIAGKLPWEYPYSHCIVLCKGCHAAEHGLIRPKVGWTLVGQDDLGELDGECECCGNQIRHIFYIYHEGWGTIGVGTYCCDNLTETMLASNLIESQRRYDDRVKRFVASVRWTAGVAGVLWIKQKGLTVEIVPASGGLRIRMNGIFGGILYSSADDAKRRAFDAIESGKAEKYIRSQQTIGLSKMKKP